MCNGSSFAEMVFLIIIVFGFIVFVVGINWLAWIDHNRSMDRLYGKKEK